MVVDNCSPRDGEQEAVGRLCAEQGCTLIQAKENRGYNAGNNIGLRYAASRGYRYALIANPDMEFPQRNYIETLVAAMDADDGIAVCGSDIITPEGVHQNPMKRDGDWRSSFGWIAGLLHRNRNADTYDFIDNYTETHRCAKVSGCCLLVRMSFVERTGFFDEQVFLYCEEAILSRQVEREGLEMLYIADAQAVHRHVKSEKGDPARRFRTWKDSRYHFIDRYSGDGAFGRMMAKLSMACYVSLMTTMFSVRRRLWRRKG